MLLGLLAAAAIFLLRNEFVRGLLPFRGDWRADARRLLLDLKDRLPGLDGRTAVSEFSELLRRIAMARTARDECAGLSGPDWLEWLGANDPSGFDWCTYGRLIIEVPYAPPGTSVDAEEMRRLIDAAANWLVPDVEESMPSSQIQREPA